MEIWKSIAYNYKVSTNGRIASYWNGKPQILKPLPNDQGYLRVALRIGDTKKFYRIHRLVAEAFIPNPDNKPEINHLNGNKADNRVENLEWCTRSENMKHAFATGIRKSSKKSNVNTQQYSSNITDDNP